jgi:hypothetical protein
MNDTTRLKYLRIALALILVASWSVHATEALSFNGGGHTIEILIGYEDNPVVAKFSLRLPEPQTGSAFRGTFFTLKSST